MSKSFAEKQSSTKDIILIEVTQNIWEYTCHGLQKKSLERVTVKTLREQF
jgi:hypothetical protein